MKFKPFAIKNNTWKRVSFGINNIFILHIYKNGFTLAVCYFGTILKKIEYSFSFPNNIQIIKY